MRILLIILLSAMVVKAQPTNFQDYANNFAWLFTNTAASNGQIETWNAALGWWMPSNAPAGGAGSGNASTNISQFWPSPQYLTNAGNTISGNGARLTNLNGSGLSVLLATNVPAGIGITNPIIFGANTNSLVTSGAGATNVTFGAAGQNGYTNGILTAAGQEFNVTHSGTNSFDVLVNATNSGTLNVAGATTVGGSFTATSGTLTTPGSDTFIAGTFNMNGHAIQNIASLSGNSANIPFLNAADLRSGANISSLVVTNGTSTYSISTTLVSSSTKISNSSGVDMKVYLTAATGLSYTNSAGTLVFSGQTVAALTPFVLQPKEQLVGTAITCVGTNGF